MAAPVMVSRTKGSGDASTATVTMPSGVAAGDLLMVFIGADSSSNEFAASGWTRIAFGEAGTNGTAAFYKTAAGGDTCTITGIDNEPYAWLAARITGWSGAAPAVSSLATGNNASPNPPSLNAGSAGEYLWLCFTSQDGGGTYSAYPSGYTGDSSGSTANVGVAWKTSTNQTEDPGTFTCSRSDDWAAFTIATKGAAATPPPAVDTGGFFAFF